ncbi:QcrA and Rieske domain-containing protein [Dyadobacter pollutisoli]|uniref:Rieske (2Fe-2S) protein n=1 Tax=Dyadobacter pollutisoli TaxID=2910158 RepID=A0A9E8SKL6_9BACT|nr:Rieske (2Fe-2S) protein [Dyadobacter pollutisoli]WAC11354.1 Rieske (2Fe-2S) protein [Dyadobacter pollutisoli]
METTTQDKMKRGQFLRSLGLSTSTLMAFYCLGTTMTACGSKDDDPDPVDPNPNPGGGTGVTGTTTGGSINFTVDLTINSSLKTAGEYKIFGDVLVAFTTNSTYVALTKICTHEGNPVQYRKSSNDIMCPTHGSEYSITGTVTQGPAPAPLKTYTVTLSADGKTLTVKA